MGWVTSMPFTSINPTNPRTNPWNFGQKILRIGWAELENDILLCFLFWVIRFFKKFCFFLLFINEKTKGFHMRYHSFLHYGWFLQNLGKDFIPTNMHTTVSRGKLFKQLSLNNVTYLHIMFCSSQIPCSSTYIICQISCSPFFMYFFFRAFQSNSH